MGLRRHGGVAALLAAVVAVQQLTAWTDSGYYLTPLTCAAYYGLVVVGLCLLMGYAGQISLGHAGFFAIGGYASATLTTRLNLAAWAERPEVAWLLRWGWLLRAERFDEESFTKVTSVTFHPWPAAVLAIALAAGVAFLIGGPVLKLRGHYLAMATLGFGMIVQAIAKGFMLFGGADGISDVPALPLGGSLKVCRELSDKVPNYYIAWVLVALALLLARNLVDSRVGRALRAIHGAEEAAAAMGVDAARYKLKTFVLSAALAALAGVFMTHFNGGIGPSEASVMKSVRYVSLVAVGGMASLWGALLMSLVLNFLALRGFFALHGTSYDDAVFGAILIAVMLFAPQGLLRVDLGSLWRKWFTRVRASRTPA